MVSTPKMETENMLNKLPDNSSFEDIQYHLYVVEKIRKGRNQVDDGLFVTSEEARKRFDKWIIK